MNQSPSGHWPFWHVFIVLALSITAYYFIATPGPDAIYGYLALLVVLAYVIGPLVRGDTPRQMPWFMRPFLTEPHPKPESESGPKLESKQSPEAP